MVVVAVAIVVGAVAVVIIIVVVGSSDPRFWDQGQIKRVQQKRT